jgi:hypothetical protein
MSLVVIVLLVLVAVFAITAILALLGSVEMLPLPRGATDALIKLTGIQLLAVIAAVVAVPFIVQSADRFLAELPEDVRGSGVSDTVSKIKAQAAQNAELEQQVASLKAERDTLSVQAQRSLENLENFEAVRGDVLLALLQLKQDVDDLGTPSISLTYPGEEERKAEAAARIALVLRELRVPVAGDDPATVEAALAEYQRALGFSEEASKGYFGPGTWRVLLTTFVEGYAPSPGP